MAHGEEAMQYRIQCSAMETVQVFLKYLDQGSLIKAHLSALKEVRKGVRWYHLICARA